MGAARLAPITCPEVTPLCRPSRQPAGGRGDPVGRAVTLGRRLSRRLCSGPAISVCVLPRPAARRSGRAVPCRALPCRRPARQPTAGRLFRCSQGLFASWPASDARLPSIVGRARLSGRPMRRLARPQQPLFVDVCVEFDRAGCCAGVGSFRACLSWPVTYCVAHPRLDVCVGRPRRQCLGFGSGDDDTRVVVLFARRAR